MGKQWKQCQTLLFFGRGASKITADGDCSHKIKRLLLLGRKVMTNLDRGKVAANRKEVERGKNPIQPYEISVCKIKRKLHDSKT